MAWTVGKDGIVRSTQIIPVEEIMFGHYLQRVFTENSSKIALIETKTGMQYTFAELFEICKSVAARIQQHGVKAGDHVLFCAETGLQSSIVQLALLLCHVTLVVTKPISTVYELRETLDKFSELKLIIGDKMSSTNLLQSTKVKIVEVNDLCKSGHHSEFQSPPNGDPKTEVMLMVMTSGSTGASKAVCLSHYYMLADKIQANSCFEQFLMFNPLSHLSGMICFLFTIISGETVFIASESLKDDIEEFLDTCLKFKPLTILALPVMLNKITKYGATDKLKSMKRIITGGSYVSQGLVNEFQSLHPHINVENLFGSSEAGVNLRSISSDKIQHLSVLPNVEVKIVDVETEKILGANEIGMLYSRAPTMSLGYYKNEKATAEAFKDGWHVLGDLAYRDEEGRIFIVDRLKQMIKCMGYQVSPADLEVVLEKDDEVLQVLVCGLPHEEFGEAAAAFVVPRKTSNLPELRSRLMKEIEAKFIMQKHLHGGLYFVSSIPETDSGKASRKDMASMHLKKQIEYLE